MAEGGLKSLAQGRSDIYKVDPRQLHVKPSWNGRDFNDPTNVEHIDMLAASIAVVGVKEPLTVVWEEGKAWLVDGECRLRATLKAIDNGAPIKTIPVKGEDRNSNDADRLFSQIIRNSGKSFSQMEQANVYKRLLDMGWQQSDIASKSGVSCARISQVLNLLTMPEPVKQMVTNGQVSASMAQKVVAEHNPQQAVQMLQDAVVIAESEGKAKAMPKHLPIAPAPVASRQTLESAIHDAFDASDIDYDGCEDDDDLVILKMPYKHWNILREKMKL